MSVKYFCDGCDKEIKTIADRLPTNINVKSGNRTPLSIEVDLCN